jgi:hypothetical protein
MEKEDLREFKKNPAYFLETISKENKTLADVLYKMMDIDMVSSLDEFNSNCYSLSKILAATDIVMLTGCPTLAIETYKIIGYPHETINLNLQTPQTLENENIFYIV